MFKSLISATIIASSFIPVVAPTSASAFGFFSGTRDALNAYHNQTPEERAAHVALGEAQAAQAAADEPVVSEWDYFFGTTLNPENSGWNDFWYQCQDENKTVGDCIGTIAVGVTAVVALPILAGAALVATPVIGSVATVAAAPASVAIGASITDAQQTLKEF